MEPIKPLKERCFLFGWPVVRGVAVFADSMIKGMKALTYSAELLPEEEQEKDKIDLWLEKKLGSEKAEKAVIAVAAVLGLALAVALFIVLPTFLIGLIPGLEGQYGLRNLLEGVVKLAILLAYLWLCSNMKDMKRIFSYHGAEHKTIFCYEKGLPLTVEKRPAALPPPLRHELPARGHHRRHPRGDADTAGQHAAAHGLPPGAAAADGGREL